LDQDDRWLPKHISTLESAIAARPEVGIVWDNFRYISSGGRPMCVRIAESRPPVLTAESLLLDCYLIVNGAVVRRSAIEKVGLFDENIFLADDHDMCLRLLEAFPAAYIPNVGWEYRLHPEQSSFNPLMWKNAEQVLAKAIARYPYSRKVIRKRRAVLAYRHGEIAFRERRVFRGIVLLCKAATLDPPRALMELGQRTKSLINTKLHCLRPWTL
jgi:GT2 family glycosyltransferase